MKVFLVFIKISMEINVTHVNKVFNFTKVIYFDNSSN